MKMLPLLLSLAFLACPARGQATFGVVPLVCAGNFGGPPNYPCASISTSNPGKIAPLFTSSNPSGTVNTSHGAIGACAANCMQWASGDGFITTWPVSTGGSLTVTVNGVKYGVSAWNAGGASSSAVATLTSNPGTQTGVSFLNYSACKPGTSLNGTGAGCAGSTGYDATIPGYVVGSGCITRGSDQATFPGGPSPVGTQSQGSGQNQTSLHGTYFVATNSGGKNFLAQTTLIGNCLQVAWNSTFIDSGNITFDPISDTTFYSASGAGTYGTEVDKCTITAGSYPSPPTFSCASYFDYFSGGGSSGGPACPGVTPYTVLSGPGEFGVSSDGHRFAAMWGAHGQGSAYQTFVYDASLPGCWMVDWSTGNVYGGPSSGFCTSSCGPSTAAYGTLQDTVSTTTTAAVTVTGSQSVSVASVSNLRTQDYLLIDKGTGTQETALITAVGGSSFTANFTQLHSSGAAVQGTSCWGAPGASSTTLNLHEVLQPAGGTWVNSGVSAGGGWTRGNCSGNNTEVILATPGATTSFFMDATATYGYSSHSSFGVTHVASPYFTGPTLRSMSTPDTFAQFFSGTAWTNIFDTHSSWPHACAATGTIPNDNCPWFQISDEVQSSQGSAGTGNCPNGTLATICPNYLQNAIFALFPNAVNQTPVVFAHTFACNPSTGNGAQCPSGIRDGFGPGNAIGNVSPDGTMVWWVSTMLQSLGVDNTNAFAASVFVMRL